MDAATQKDFLDQLRDLSPDPARATQQLARVLTAIVEELGPSAHAGAVEKLQAGESDPRD